MIYPPELEVIAIMTMLFNDDDNNNNNNNNNSNNNNNMIAFQNVAIRRLEFQLLARATITVKTKQQF